MALLPAADTCVTFDVPDRCDRQGTSNTGVWSPIQLVINALLRVLAGPAFTGSLYFVK